MTTRRSFTESSTRPKSSGTATGLSQQSRADDFRSPQSRSNISNQLANVLKVSSSRMEQVKIVQKWGPVKQVPTQNLPRTMVLACPSLSARTRPGTMPTREEVHKYANTFLHSNTSCDHIRSPERKLATPRKISLNDNFTENSSAFLSARSPGHTISYHAEAPIYRDVGYQRASAVVKSEELCPTSPGPDGMVQTSPGKRQARIAQQMLALPPSVVSPSPTVFKVPPLQLTDMEARTHRTDSGNSAAASSRASTTRRAVSVNHMSFESL